MCLSKVWTKELSLQNWRQLWNAEIFAILDLVWDAMQRSLLCVQVCYSSLGGINRVLHCLSIHIGIICHISLVSVTDISSSFHKSSFQLLFCLIKSLYDLWTQRFLLLVLVGRWTLSSCFVGVLSCFVQELERIFLISIISTLILQMGLFMMILRIEEILLVC